MNKGLFLERLRVSLSGKVPASVVEENVAYYEDYINTQVRLGYAEEAVLNSLGDPRLLAKTIVTTNGEAVQEGRYREVEEEFDVKRKRKEWLRLENMPGWAWKVIGIVAFALVVSLMFSIISFLIPFVFPCLLVWLIYKTFRDWLR